PRPAGDRGAHSARLHPSRHPLRLQQLRPEPSADGIAPAPEGQLQPLWLPRSGARGPACAQALRLDRGRQWLLLVHHWGSEPALERRRPRPAQGRARLRFRGRQDWADPAPWVDSRCLAVSGLVGRCRIPLRHGLLYRRWRCGWQCGLWVLMAVTLAGDRLLELTHPGTERAPDLG